MPSSPACVKCGSAEIVLKARVLDQAGEMGEVDLQVRVDANPAALFFREPVRVPLKARVCGQCGYTEFYATDPAALFAAWHHSQKSGG